MSEADIQALAAAIGERVAERLRADADRLLDRATLAQRLGIGERTVSGLVARSELPPPLLHTGGLARWRWESVLAWLAGRADRQVKRGRGRWSRIKNGA
jgi:predicted DNA-binding transcriptional regulator AlpA